MVKLAHFSISAEDCERTMAFYRKAFGWKFNVGWHYDAPEGSRKYWLIDSGSDEPVAAQGGLTAKRGPVTGISLVFEVDSLDDYVGRIGDNGAEILEARAASPGTRWFASCRDTEGSLFAISEAQPQAG